MKRRQENELADLSRKEIEKKLKGVEKRREEMGEGGVRWEGGGQTSF